MTRHGHPADVHFVAFDAALIHRVAEELLDVARHRPSTVRIEVDETHAAGAHRASRSATRSRSAPRAARSKTPSGRASRARSPPRRRSAGCCCASRDRLSGGFGEAPPDDELSLAQVAAWETYCVGRLERLGIAVNQQRWLYNFRNRHGFTDAADAAFDRAVDERRPDVGASCEAISDVRRCRPRHECPRESQHDPARSSDIDVNGVDAPRPRGRRPGQPDGAAVPRVPRAGVLVAPSDGAARRGRLPRDRARPARLRPLVGAAARSPPTASATSPATCWPCSTTSARTTRCSSATTGAR